MSCQPLQAEMLSGTMLAFDKGVLKDDAATLVARLRRMSSALDNLVRGELQNA